MKGTHKMPRGTGLLLTAVFLLRPHPDGATAKPALRLSGQVQTGGSSLNRQVTIQPVFTASSGSNRSGATQICRNDFWSRLQKLSGMSVRISGHFKNPDKKSTSCFTVEEFMITRMSSGRPPLIGTLEKQNNSYKITTAQGQRITLAESSGMDSLLGKKVILDTKPPPPFAEDVTPKVASYMEYP